MNSFIHMHAHASQLVTPLVLPPMLLISTINVVGVDYSIRLLRPCDGVGQSDLSRTNGRSLPIPLLPSDCGQPALSTRPAGSRDLDPCRPRSGVADHVTNLKG